MPRGSLKPVRGGVWNLYHILRINLDYDVISRYYKSSNVTPMDNNMPTQKTRINLTVDDDMDGLLTELAALQGIPKTTLVYEYLEAMRPHMIEIRDAIRMVNEKKDPSKHLRKMLLDGQQDFLDVLKEEFKND
jgi:hypothetical protein